MIGKCKVRLDNGLDTSPDAGQMRDTMQVRKTRKRGACPRLPVPVFPSTFWTKQRYLTPSPTNILGPNSGDFAVQGTTCGITLGYGNHCTYSLTFTPQGTGTRTATLNINTNSVHSPYTVILTGTGM